MIRFVLMNHQIAKCTGLSRAAYVCMHTYTHTHTYTLVCISRTIVVCRSDSPLDCYSDVQLIWIKGTINQRI